MLSSDGFGGAIVVREDSVQATMRATRVLADGHFASGWPSLGVKLDINPDDIRVAPDGSGGAYVLGRNNFGHFRLFGWHVLAGGGLDSLTPSSGLSLIPTSQNPTAIDMMSDGQGGVYVAWDTLRTGNTGSDLILQRYTGAFQVHSGWPAAGLSLDRSILHNLNPRILPAPNGDILVVFDSYTTTDGGTYVTRLSPDASFPVPALSNGALVSIYSGNNAVAPDGNGGVYCAYPTDNPDPRSNPYMQYLRGDGTRAPGWPEKGLPLAVGKWIKLDFNELASDGIGGAYMSWTDKRTAANSADSYLQHVRPDAALYPGWPQGGLDIGNNAGAYDIGAILHGDGHGGVWTVYESDNFIDGNSYMMANHLGSDGVPLPGWRVNGWNIAPNASVHNDTYPTYIVDDGRGGVIVAWESAQFGGPAYPIVFVQRFSGDGLVATDFSLVASQATPDRVDLEWQTASQAGSRFAVQRQGAGGTWNDLATVDANGQSRVLYTDVTVSAGERYAYRLESGNGSAARYSTDTWVSVPAAFHFALAGARPNPASSSSLAVSFSLERSLPAALEVFDVGGRRVALRDVGAMGGGEHVLPLGRDLHLAQGLYWLRLTQGGHRATSRVVVTE
jgi:hypothetical protein